MNPRIALHRNVARRMVRRHLSDLVRADVGTEDQLVTAYLHCMQQTPDALFATITHAFRMTVNQALLRQACRPAGPTIRTLSTEG